MNYTSLWSDLNSPDLYFFTLIYFVNIYSFQGRRVSFKAVVNSGIETSVLRDSIYDADEV